MHTSTKSTVAVIILTFLTFFSYGQWGAEHAYKKISCTVDDLERLLISKDTTPLELEVTLIEGQDTDSWRHHLNSGKFYDDTIFVNRPVDLRIRCKEDKTVNFRLWRIHFRDDLRLSFFEKYLYFSISESTVDGDFYASGYSESFKIEKCQLNGHYKIELNIDQQIEDQQFGIYESKLYLNNAKHLKFTAVFDTTTAPLRYSHAYQGSIDVAFERHFLDTLRIYEKRY